MSANHIQKEVQILAGKKPGTKGADKARWAIETSLMAMLKSSGIRGIRAALKEVSADGQRFELVENLDGNRRWLMRTSGDRVVELTVYSASGVQSTSVHYRVERAQPPARGPERGMETQSAFYKHYETIAKIAHASEGNKRLRRNDRLILLVGEMEADVNNGGFSQYLLNKGRRRAKQALEALRTVGAAKTAALLEQALQAGISEAELDRLDSRYFRKTEDAAALVAKHLQLATS